MDMKGIMEGIKGRMENMMGRMEEMKGRMEEMKGRMDDMKSKIIEGMKGMKKKKKVSVTDNDKGIAPPSVKDN